MGQILSWIRGPPRDGSGLQDVAVEQQSQPRQATPTQVPQASPAKPAQFEKASAGMATEPGKLTTATGSGLTAGKGAPKETALVAANPAVVSSTIIDMTAAGGTVIDMNPSGAKGCPKDVPKTLPITQVGAAATASGPSTGAVGSTVAAGVAAPASSTAAPKPKDSPKAVTKSVETLKANLGSAEPAKVEVSKPAATGPTSPGVSEKGRKDGVKPSQPKVEVEVPKAEAKLAKKDLDLDPFDALASSLPPPEPVAPEPVYTGPEVKEHGVTSEEAVRVGERDDTLPPGYRFENVPPGERHVKPKDVPKPMTTDDALDSLSAGFTSFTAPDVAKKGEKKDDIAVAATAGQNIFAPPPVQKSGNRGVHKEPRVVDVVVDTPEVAVCPPADKKPKVDKAGDFSLTDICPPVKELDIHLPVCHAAFPTKKAPEPVLVLVDDKKAAPKGDEGGFMSLDALSALGDTLPASEPKPEPPPVRPEDIVSEDKLKKEKGVRVGEHESSIPPEYRFSADKHKDLPRPAEPTVDMGEALDFLSEGFATPSAAPSVQAPVVCPPAPLPSQSKVDEMSALDSLAEQFVAPAKASNVQAPTPPTAKEPKIAVCDFGAPKPIDLKKTPEIAICDFGTSKPTDPKKRPEMSVCEPCKPMETVPVKKGVKQAPPAADEGGFMSLDALSALGDTLPVAEPKRELPPVKPEDIVTEAELKDEEGVLVGEKESSIPPEYRFKEEDLKNLPAPKPEPTMDASEALDFLSEGFSTPSTAPTVQAVVAPSAPPAQPEDDFDLLAGGCVVPSAAATVRSAVPPTNTARQLSLGTDGALDALSDTLMDINPVPEPVAPPPAKDLVKEKKVVEERIIKPGEKDDSLPPEYRPTEEDRKKWDELKAKEEAEGKKTKPMDDLEALEALSSDFSSGTLPAPAGTCSAASADPKPQQQMKGPVLDSLAQTLLPNTPEYSQGSQEPQTSKGDKPKGKSKSRSKSKKHQAVDVSATDHLPGQLSSSVVPSAKKGGKS